MPKACPWQGLKVTGFFQIQAPVRYQEYNTKPGRAVEDYKDN